ncbi:MAG: hypothetical protein DRI57_08735 [Deltaproteobacteria bacterium]|nr:MAG: hypothetical protein DRI57_08735 [Deltaproteobacteria bacterium]
MYKKTSVTTVLIILSFFAIAVASRFAYSQPVRNSDFGFENDMEAEKVAERKLDAILSPQNAVKEKSADYEKTRETLLPSDESHVKMSLSDFENMRKELATIRDRKKLLQGPAVVPGSSEYTGKAVKGALRLKLRLSVTLGRPEKWKTVPLVGDKVVLAKVTADGNPIAVSRKNSYHVWMTKKAGEAVIDMELLVPSHGPRGSTEYDFLIVKTPVTKFSCYFPVHGLEPRLTASVKSSSTSQESGTLFSAVLRPTAKIHLVGFKDLGEDKESRAKVYTENLNLLSIEEDALELFTVIRYTILYSGTKAFNILIPEGMSVVSADGRGAFRYALEPAEKGTLLRGETAFHIRNNYEISLRLKREVKNHEKAFKVPLPSCMDVERESGWLGVEVPGKLKLEERTAKNVQAVDVRQLPENMIRSAVSPILRAYRYHSADAEIIIFAKLLPEIEPSSGSIDRVRAFTKVTDKGNVITEMRITLRNRLRHSIALKLPEGADIISSMLDGQPLNLSRSKEGILLPLKRSAGFERLKPFTISVVIENRTDRSGWFGTSSLNLPSVDLPVSSLVWTVYLPQRNTYSALESDIGYQKYAGRVSWHQPAFTSAPARGTGMGDSGNILRQMTAAGHSSAAGAMPVRFAIPKKGKRLDYARYWIEAGKPVSLKFSYLRSWLNIPAMLFLVLFIAFGIFTALTGFSSKRKIVAGTTLLIISGTCAYLFYGINTALSGIVPGIIAAGVYKNWLNLVIAYGSGVTERFLKIEKEKKQWKFKRIVRHAILFAGFVIFGTMFFNNIVRLLKLLIFRALEG